jgi:hypothetical protein
LAPPLHVVFWPDGDCLEVTLRTDNVLERTAKFHCQPAVCDEDKPDHATTDSPVFLELGTPPLPRRAPNLYGSIPQRKRLFRTCSQGLDAGQALDSERHPHGAVSYADGQEEPRQHHAAKLGLAIGRLRHPRRGIRRHNVDHKPDLYRRQVREGEQSLAAHFKEPRNLLRRAG